MENNIINGKADINQINKWYQTGLDEWSDYRERARLSNKFYFGQQWDVTTEQKLKSEGKPALIFNKIKPIVRTLSGYMRQNRRDLKVIARRGGVQSIASIYTELIKYVYDISYADWYNAMAFTDGIIGGKGWISIDKDYSRDPVTGDLLIMREDPFLILEDPFSQRYDLSDARFIFRSRWLDKNQLELMFPKVKDMAVEIGQSASDSVSQSVESKDYDEAEKKSSLEIAKNRYLTKECWYKSYTRKKFLISKGLETIDISSESAEAIQMLLIDRPDLRMVERVTPVLRLAIVLGNTILYEKEDPYNGMIYFPVVRFANELFCTEKNFVRGEVEDIISAQEEHNKRKSQTLHILNSNANSGYIVEEQAMDPEQLRKLESMGSRPGVVVKVKEGKLASQQRIMPPQLSEGHVALANIADNDMKAISGVNADLLGSDRTDANSGIAMEMRRRQGLINLEPVFDNNDFTQRILGDTLLEIIRKTDVYTPEEILAIVGGKVKTIDGKPVTGEEIVSFMQSPQGMYSTVMSQADSSASVRASNFKDMIGAIKEAQIPVPPEMIVEASDWQFKDQWMEWFKTQQSQQSQQQPPQEGMPQDQGQPPLPPELLQALGG
jgi:hypothetical protein